MPMFQNVGADAYKPGLDNVLRLSEAFGNPHLRLRTIHVGGTNGKGSTSSLLASVMTESGLRTGLFTSPHLVDFRERMRIDGKMIPHACVVDFIDRFRNMHLDFEPSFFELTTVMAFEWFARSGVDIAVIEVGLGGRLDSTNIITPEISVITNISLDHTALLGHTPEAIAREKAGIIKAGIPAIIGHAEGGVREVFRRRAAEAGAPIIFAEDNRLYDSMSIDDGLLVYNGTPWGNVASPLTGDCQAENANTVFNALKLLNISDDAAVSRGFVKVIENTGLMGRWTTLSNNPRVICDTGHNVGGWEWLAPRLASFAESGRLHMVIGFVNDKDVSTILGMMPKNARYYFCTPSVRRGRNGADLQALAAEYGLISQAYDSVAEGYEAARTSATADGTIFVGGSTFVVADLLSEFFSKK